MRGVHPALEARPFREDGLHLAAETVGGTVDIGYSEEPCMGIQMQSGTYAVEASDEDSEAGQIGPLYEIRDGGYPASGIQFGGGLGDDLCLVPPHRFLPEKDAATEVTPLHSIGVGHGDVAETRQDEILHDLVAEGARTRYEDWCPVDAGHIDPLSAFHAVEPFVFRHSDTC